MAFDDVSFPNDIARGAIGGPSFNSQVCKSVGGFRQSNARWSAPLRTWDVGHEIYSITKLESLMAFHLARQGRVIAFRFRDWSDYYVGMSYSDPQNINLQYTSYQQFATGDGATKIFQLTRAYVDPIRTTYRNITRPVSGSVKIYLNGVNQASGWSVDTTTGLVTFVTAPGIGVAIQWAGMFDVPCCFGSDKMAFTHEMVRKGEMTSIVIEEVREPA